ncbi:hypothetical protein [Candidatus Uabimicrobium sp. HlEnr_7]|uniref:hypothetical protein n=1 Tax=Candidatus Uabimicrobium helgolandensis TaxID=3095367 RepID=UPI0035565F7D
MTTKIIVYIILFVVGVKFFFWGRKQQKKHSPKWGWRLTIFFFLAPLIVYFIDKLLPVPDEGIHILKAIVKYMDYPIIFIYENVKEHLGWWAWFAKPAIAALFYGIIGFFIGTMLDSSNDEEEDED